MTPEPPVPTSERIAAAAAYAARLHDAGDSTPGTGAHEARRLAVALRRVTACVVGAGTPPDALRRAADRAEAILDDLEAAPAPGRYGPLPMASENDASASTLFDWSPLAGLGNPVAPPMTVRVEAAAATVVGDVTFGLAYEGPPGCVHGGCIAAGFDEILGQAQGLLGRVGMTGRLVVRYRRPTPVLRPLRYEAWIDAVDGRKATIVGRLLAGDRVTAEAEGLFIAVSGDHVADLAPALDVGD